MATLILHKDGAYNLYSTISEGPYFLRALTLEQLTKEIRNQYGQVGLDELPARLERAHKTGTSSLIGSTLAECILCNCDKLSLDDFIARYLTLNQQPESANHD